MCNKGLGKDLFTIKDKFQEFIDYKTTPDEVLSPQNLSDKNVFHVTKEDII